MSTESKGLQWGLGIEHEMHIYHKPSDTTKNINTFTLYNAYDAIQRLISKSNNKDISLDSSEIELIKNVPFEWSGRQCDGKVVIQRVPIQMPEFVTNNPFCSIKDKRTITNMTEEIIILKKMFYKLLKKDSLTQKFIKKYGELTQYPYGMTRYLKYPVGLTKNNDYIFEKDKNGKDKIVPEYNGSYHITFTLPHSKTITNKDFIKIHQNFANQLQWLEPLMLTTYFSGDEYAPGSLRRVRGSFRVMIIGWGNFAGSNVRLFNKGIGRYAKTPTYWRKGLKFIDSNKLKACYKPSLAAKKEGAITSLSSNFRTFGSTDPNRPWHRESGTPMTKPNGIEFRIFDHFNDEYIQHLLLFVSLVAENSRLKKTSEYVYKNKYWIEAMHEIMKYGYNARLSNKYIQLLRDNLGLKINTKSLVAIDVFKTILNELFKKNINGKWSKIFHHKTNKYILKSIINPINFPNVNFNAWRLAFLLKLNKEKTCLNKFNILNHSLKNKKISYNDFTKLFLKKFGKNWKDDVESIVYFYEYMDICNLKKDSYGNINSIVFKKNIQKFKNFNDEIIKYFE